MRKAWTKSGSTIVVALLVVTVVLTLAVTLLGQRVTQRRVVNARFVEAQAKALAWAGLEDARLKLLKSKNFPPNLAAGGSTFSFSEVLDDGAGNNVGTYLVEVDLRFSNKAVIYSRAILEGETEARCLLRGELDTEDSRPSIQDLGGSVGTESRAFLWIRVEVLDGQANQV